MKYCDQELNEQLCGIYSNKLCAINENAVSSDFSCHLDGKGISYTNSRNCLSFLMTRQTLALLMNLHHNDAVVRFGTEAKISCVDMELIKS